jgi:23S rRNA (cytosine1962-C5)-methyltransferase
MNTTKTPKVILKPGREKSIVKKHPWLFSGAIHKTEGDPQPGDTVMAVSSKGEFLAYCAYSPHSQIRIRAWSWDEKEQINKAFFEAKIENAIKLRQSIGLLSNTDLNNCCRLINSESDGLPGIIADLYDKTVVIQFLTVGAEKWKDVITDVINDKLNPVCIYERSDVDERILEGLERKKGLLRGVEPEGKLTINENGLKILIDIKDGHKTGFYLDQRDNRNLIRDYSAGRDVLNCFSYTGGFTLNALAGGANHVTSVDSSGKSLETAKENVKLNGLDESKCSFVEADVFKLLRQYRDDNRLFDMIVLDPPKFASGTGKLETALRGYKDINMIALKILKPGGILFTFSCSGGVTDEMFQRAVAWASLDAECRASIIKKMTQGADHPVALNFPESFYLKGLVVYKS